MHGIAVRAVVPTGFSESTGTTEWVNLVILQRSTDESSSLATLAVTCPMKSPIRNLTIHSKGIEPTSLRRRVRIELGHVWLDVEQRSVVEDVYVENMEEASFAPR